VVFVSRHRDFFLDDFLGSASTISDGAFTITFDEGAFRDLFDRWPDAAPGHGAVERFAAPSGVAGDQGRVPIDHGSSPV
jgi:hypothetical protein